jgi:two-component system nitrogen regulation sensor histidine kinase GlnL
VKNWIAHRQNLETRILDNLSAAVLLFDHDLRLRYINPAGEMLLAVSSRHLLNQPAADLVHCPGGQIARDLRSALESGQPFAEREVVMPRPDGVQITVDCTITPLIEPGRQAEVLVELQQVDRQLRISREEQLIMQGQAVREIVRGLAHEIKNPLGGLRGAAQLLERELPDDSLYEYTHIIIDEADRLQSLLNRMLGPNKLPQRSEVNIHNVLERVRNLVAAEVGGEVRFRVDYDPSIPPLQQADSDQLIQAFLNIMRNAARAVGVRGSITLRTRVLRQFTIGMQRHALVLRADVEDNGPGIPSELQPSIFYPMVSAAEGGSGLGLSIAQTLVNQHQGLIECSSKPGQTVFSVLLPLERGDDQRH